MDEYADFVEAAILAGNPVLAMQQKKIEERIRRPFCLSRDTPDNHMVETFPQPETNPRQSAAIRS
jgi:hypothetical protein